MYISDKKIIVMRMVPRGSYMPAGLADSADGETVRSRRGSIGAGKSPVGGSQDASPLPAYSSSIWVVVRYQNNTLLLVLVSPHNFIRSDASELKQTHSGYTRHMFKALPSRASSSGLISAFSFSMWNSSWFWVALLISVCFNVPSITFIWESFWAASRP
ncbi:hypothetical protein EYF80_034615 [Liparis tanakae]|uniref:Uncharacterized protein n=1 Tax=Liparis tanakae TaxID=230148 RepID=A0A4Z2GPK4_9TELE|nr:hypothetical protein EYF80_034615 [Liparis tanakae]